MRIVLWSDNGVMNAGATLSFVLFCFLGFLLALYLLSLRRRRGEQKARGPLPRISILVPTFNEEGNIERCLESIERSGYPKELCELIVIDDASTDGTVAAVRAYRARHERTGVTLVEVAHDGKVGALNEGLRHATAPLIITVDADVTITPDTFFALVEPLADEKVGATNAVVLVEKPTGFVGHCQAVEYAMNNLIRTSFERVFGSSVWFFGNVACFRRSALQLSGSFRADTLTEDMDISLALMRAGFTVKTCEGAIVYTSARPSVLSLIRQRMRWYVGALQTLAKHRGMFRNAPTPATAFLYTNQCWWTIFSFLFFPLTAYEVWYWWPHGSGMGAGIYIVRWFSLWGPFYVLYKVPEWGVSVLNIFGVLSGIITLLLSIGALIRFKVRPYPAMALALFFYFPYTIIMNVSIIAGVVSHPFRTVRYFKK
ncbi:MAG: glycosyltransferase family 2 protein [Thermoanaerobaculaceae bacterium]|jgi:cellulose synthase/poly-beta-1,6-N-acetylglucosamine synthase-like glycosyltransferase